MNDSELIDEVNALKAIYGDNSINLHSGWMTAELDVDGRTVSLKLRLTDSYPDEAPSQVSLSCHPTVSGDALARIKHTLVDSIESIVLKREPYLMSILMTLQDLMLDCSSEMVCPIQNPNQGIDWISIIKLDHMRDKRNYLKCLRKWCSELSVDGFLMIMNQKKYVMILKGKKSG